MKATWQANSELVDSVIPKIIDFNVALTRLYYSPNSNGDYLCINNKNAVIRTDTNQYLGIVGDRYNPIQNRDFFNFFTNVCDISKLKISNAGIVGNGSKIWLSTKLPETIKLKNVDELKYYILFINSHDGSTAMNICITPIRVACENTLMIATRKAVRNIKIMHTKNYNEKIHMANSILNIAYEYVSETSKTFEYLSNIKLSDKEAYMLLLNTVSPDPVKNVDEVSKRTLNVVDYMMNILHSNVGGMDMETTKGTAFGVFNALAYYYDHIKYSDSSGKDGFEPILFGHVNEKRNKLINLVNQSEHVI